MARPTSPQEHPSEEGGRPLRTGVGRKGRKHTKSYVVTVCGVVPGGLAERISAAHAVAIRDRGDRSRSTAREALS